MQTRMKEYRLLLQQRDTTEIYRSFEIVKKAARPSEIKCENQGSQLEGDNSTIVLYDCRDCQQWQCDKFDTQPSGSALLVSEEDGISGDSHGK